MRLTDWLKKHFTVTPSVADPRVVVTSHSVITRTIVTPVVTGIRSSASRERRRARRRRRRSRESIVGLPLYSVDPNDAEMTLVKTSRPSLDSATSHLSLLNYSSDEDQDQDSISIAPTTPRLREPSSRVRSSSSATNASSLYPTSNPNPPIYGNAESNESSIGLPFSRSLPIEEIITIPRGSSSRIGRLRASTFGSIFPSNRSSTPTVNEGIVIGRSPYGQFNNNSTVSIGGNGRIRSASVAHLPISSPLQHTLVSSAFTPPKAGLTREQMSFISSRESLGSYGYGPGSHPPSFPHSVSYSETGSTLAPPTILGRGRRANSVGSPLRALDDALVIPPLPALSNLRTSFDFPSPSEPEESIQTPIFDEFLPLPLDSTPTESSSDMIRDISTTSSSRTESEWGMNSDCSFLTARE